MLRKPMIFRKLVFVLICLIGTVGVVSVAAKAREVQQVTKALTNADIIQMAAAGLEESTIILLIRQSPTNFDISVEALLVLKSQGVNPKILNVMIEVQGAKPAVVEEEPELIGTIFYLTEDNLLVPLDRHVARIKKKIGIRADSVFAVIDGEKAQLRLKKPEEPRFIVRLVVPDELRLIHLYRFEADDKQRQVLFSKERYRQAPELLPSLSYKIRKFGISSYELTPVTSLPPGEYGFSSTNSNDVFCFGIDP